MILGFLLAVERYVEILTIIIVTLPSHNDCQNASQNANSRTRNLFSTCYAAHAIHARFVHL